MSDDKTRQDGDELPEADPVADDEVIDELEDQFDEDSSEDGAEDADLEDDADKDESGKAGKKTSKVVARKTAKAPVKKTAATRKRSETERGEHDPYRAKNPAQFVRQSVAELKKVVWPSWGELTALFSAVLLFVLFIIAYVMLLDNGFGWALLSLFGGNPPVSENTDDFEIDLGELPTPSDEVEIDLGPLGEENEPREEIALADEPEEDEPEQPEADDATAAAVAKLREELESKFGEWYVIHTYSGMENRVKQNLDSRATSLNMEDYIFETIVPTEEVVEVRNNTRKTVTRCVLPGYVLVRMELTDDSWATVRHTPSVTGFVGHGQTPVPLSLDEVVSMLTPSVVAKVASEASTAVARAKKKVEVVDFAVGDSVMVIDGPFTGVHATITEISANQQRFRALVEILGRETPVDLEFKQVEKVG